MATPPDPTAMRSYGRDWVDLTILIVVWGSSFALTKIAVGEIPPVWIVAERTAIGAAILWAVLIARGGRLPVSLGAWASCAWLAFCGNVMPFFMISWGTQFVPSALAGILMGAVPLLVMLLAALLLPDEPMTVRKAIGFVAGFAGVIMLIGPSTLLAFEFDNERTLGVLAIVLASLGYAVHGVSLRLLPQMPDLPRGAGVLIMCVVMALPVALLLEGPQAAVPGAAGLAAVTVLGIFPTALALIVVFALVRSAGASFVAMSNYLVPVFALFVGVVMLGERFTLADLAGLGLVLAGIAIAGSRRRAG
ncbi:MAG: EamA family transporter [Hyphomicrobiales bacterium]|nr:MAG: EamA family transporter [Hyphomicrobiales bacterium]